MVLSDPAKFTRARRAARAEFPIPWRYLDSGVILFTSAITVARTFAATKSLRIILGRTHHAWWAISLSIVSPKTAP